MGENRTDPNPMAPSLRWDIFSRVVDNFGDAGVCWRLARQLAREHGLAVTLWIDDVASLARIAPSLDAGRHDQVSHGVRIRRMDEAVPADTPTADVVIEAFGCGLPERYMDAMAARTRAPVWIVLEYLSGEPWIEASHMLPSPHPRLSLTRWFWFPGFTPRSGGVLRERGLMDSRDALRSDPEFRLAPWRSIGLAPGARALKVTVFCYANPALPALLEVWAEGDEAIMCVVPEGVAQPELDRFSGGAVPHPGAPLTRGRLTFAVVPFVDQRAFDRRLWTADLNLVRGEDSFVRAQWAGQPFVWHLYPQDGDAQLAKMDAFLTRLETGLPHSAQAAQRAFWYAWNAGDPDQTAASWPNYRAAMPAIGAHSAAWARALARQAGMAEGLVKFAESRL